MGDNVDNLLTLFSVCSNKSRLHILSVLTLMGPKCAGDLTKRVCLSQASVSKHLKILKENGMVSSTREGTFIYYHITSKSLSLFVEAEEFFRKVNDRK